MTASDDLDLLQSYAFELPPELIAQSPASERESARLLVVRRDPTGGLPRFEDLQVSDLPSLIDQNDELRRYLWVRNVSKVVPARFYALRKKRDASADYSRHEMVYLENAEDPRVAKAIIRGVNRFRFPETLHLEKKPGVEIEVTAPGLVRLKSGAVGWKELLEELGEMPLPPYIVNRDPSRDRERYQTVWAQDQHWGSVAAPTASLHFSQALNEKIRSQGIHFADVCLHVGLGTFEPVRVARLSEHQIHSESLFVQTEELERIRLASQGLLCLGTTALRSVESLEERDFAEGSVARRTQIFIKPGYDFRRTRALWTNFHLPESTLFALVAAFAGSLTLAQEAYRHAIQKRYRFFSYGDATLWL